MEKREAYIIKRAKIEGMQIAIQEIDNTFYSEDCEKHWGGWQEKDCSCTADDLENHDKIIDRLEYVVAELEKEDKS